MFVDLLVFAESKELQKCANSTQASSLINEINLKNLKLDGHLAKKKNHCLHSSDQMCFTNRSC